MQTRRDEAGCMTNEIVRDLAQQLDEPRLVRGLDGEHVDERHELRVLRDRCHMDSRETEIDDDVASCRVRIWAHLVSAAEKCLRLIAWQLRDLRDELDLKAESGTDGPELDVRGD